MLCSVVSLTILIFFFCVCVCQVNMQLPATHGAPCRQERLRPWGVSSSEDLQSWKIWAMWECLEHSRSVQRMDVRIERIIIHHSQFWMGVCVSHTWLQGERLSRFGFRTETTGSVTFNLHCLQQSRWVWIAEGMESVHLVEQTEAGALVALYRSKSLCFHVFMPVCFSERLLMQIWWRRGGSKFFTSWEDLANRGPFPPY